MLKCYYELPFTTHQGVHRTKEVINKKHWWETMRQDVTQFIKGHKECIQRKTDHKAKAQLEEISVATEFLDIFLI